MTQEAWHRAEELGERQFEDAVPPAMDRRVRFWDGSRIRENLLERALIMEIPRVPDDQCPAGSGGVDQPVAVAVERVAPDSRRAISLIEDPA